MQALGYLEAFILGLVEGVTEFIPVSSTGHLILTADLLGLAGEKVKVFEVSIQFGAILAVGLLYFKRLFGLMQFSKQSGFAGLRGSLCMLLGCLPAVCVGAAFSSQIKAVLFYPEPVGFALVAGAILMLLCERFAKPAVAESLDAITPKQALMIGLFQTLSLWPGISRAGSSIAGGLLVGLSRKTSAEFSFLMAVPLIAAATAYDLYKSWFFLSKDDLGVFLFGSLVAFISAYFAVKVFVALLSRVTLVPFAIYRLIVGLIVIFYFSR
jgi:undecaprenyl-diphosphatase